MPANREIVMPLPTDISTVESEVDEAFEDNALAHLPFAQGIWTLLSVVEDHHFKFTTYSPLAANQASIYADGLMNVLTHPLRVCYRSATKGPCQFQRILIDDHYTLANSWLSAAEDYDHFCSIFPLYRAGKIDLHVVGNEVIPTDWSAIDMSYEVYDRFVAKRDPEDDLALDEGLVRNEVKLAMRVIGDQYAVAFTRRLMEKLLSTLGVAFSSRYTLPSNWRFSSFSLDQFQKILTCIQVMAYAWFAARQLAAADGAPALAFSSALWTPKKNALVAKIEKHTGVKRFAIMEVLRYLTFGEVGIRNPDIAIQPLVDLTRPASTRASATPSGGAQPGCCLICRCAKLLRGSPRRRRLCGPRARRRRSNRSDDWRPRFVPLSFRNLLICMCSGCNSLGSAAMPRSL